MKRSHGSGHLYIKWGSTAHFVRRGEPYYGTRLRIGPAAHDVFG